MILVLDSFLLLEYLTNDKICFYVIGAGYSDEESDLCKLGLKFLRDCFILYDKFVCIAIDKASVKMINR